MNYRSEMNLFAILALIASTLLAVPASAQQPEGAAARFKADVVRDLDNLSQKYVGLAEAMAGKYDWRPSEGVRSVGDVFNLIVRENGMLAGALSGESAQGPRTEPITDPVEMQEALRNSYASLRAQLEAMSENDLNTTIQFFRRETTKQGALFMMLIDQHEHLGQSIAYARTNNVTPPWSR